jgi:uncharacterized damage-inducible protein DinB
MKIKNLLYTSTLLLAINFSTAQKVSNNEPSNSIQNTIHSVLKLNQNHIVQLAEAFSEEQYNWKPMNEVDSVGEAILHVATTNYSIGMRLGFTSPEDVDIMSLSKTDGKENIIDVLKKSNEYIRNVITKIKTATLSTKVDMGFAKMNTLEALLTVLEHNAEHKGQLIAYARSNNITPPWSK